MFGFIEVSKDGRLLCFNVREILFIHEEEDNCTIHTGNGYNITVNESYEDVKHMIDLSRTYGDYGGGFGSDLMKSIKRV